MSSIRHRAASGAGRTAPTRRRQTFVDASLWALFVAILVTILIFSWATKPPLASSSYTDKLGHASAYLGLSLTLLLAAVWRPGRGSGPFPRATPFVLAGCLLVGALAEVGQGLFFHRDASVRDVLIDAAGIAMAYVVWALLARSTQPRASNRG